jgi:hypothetical protein
MFPRFPTAVFVFVFISSSMILPMITDFPELSRSWTAASCVTTQDLPQILSDQMFIPVFTRVCHRPLYLSVEIVELSLCISLYLPSCYFYSVPKYSPQSSVPRYHQPMAFSLDKAIYNAKPTESNPFCVANSHSCSQEYPNILRNTNDHYCALNGHPLVPILNR